MKRKINAIWSGDGLEGTGILTAQSGAFNNMPYSFKTRFKNDDGQLGTNPEELLAASLAGCFNMKLSFVLNEANFNPEELSTLSHPQNNFAIYFDKFKDNKKSIFIVSVVILLVLTISYYFL